MGKIPRDQKEVVNFQPSLFGWQKPVAKIPMSAARIRELKEAIEKNDKLSARKKMRNLLDHVQNIERNIHNGKLR